MNVPENAMLSIRIVPVSRGSRPAWNKAAKRVAYPGGWLSRSAANRHTSRSGALAVASLSASSEAEVCIPGPINAGSCPPISISDIASSLQIS